MTNQENDSQELQPHHENDPPHDLSDEQSSTQSIHDSQQQEEEENPHLQQPNHSISAPTMISSPPPKPPPSPPPVDSSDHTSHSHGYVFSQPEVQQATYQSPPSDYSHTYVISSPPSAPTSPPVQASQTKDEQVDKSVEGGTGSSNRRPRISISERNRDDLKRKTLLVFRILGFLFCLISFSILAADKNQGWALDSFYRYKEFRYCLSINVIGFVYTGLQSYDLAFCLATGKIVAQNQLRVFLDFSFDQILAYLVLSASSTAAFRVEDWESNWGKDKFPAMARSSTVLSFLAFVAFSLSSLLSGHTLFTSKYI